MPKSEPPAEEAPRVTEMKEANKGAPSEEIPPQPEAALDLEIKPDQPKSASKKDKKEILKGGKGYDWKRNTGGCGFCNFRLRITVLNMYP
jgi:hypothetical protein